MFVYGNNVDTIVKTENGDLFIIQSTDHMPVSYEKIDELPADAELLEPILYQDLKIPVELWDEAMVEESAAALYAGGWRPSDKALLIDEHDMSDSGANRIINYFEMWE